MSQSEQSMIEAEGKSIRLAHELRSLDFKTLLLQFHEPDRYSFIATTTAFANAINLSRIVTT